MGTNRVLIGNTGTFTGTPEHGPDTPGPDYFNRQNSSGLFISKPGFDVFSCNSADLLMSTDIASNGFLMIMGTGNLQIGPGTLDEATGIITPTEIPVVTGIPAPHEPHLNNPLMTQWFVISGMGRYYGSNIYDCMGGNGIESWDGGEPDDRGLPSGFNPLYTGHTDPDESNPNVTGAGSIPGRSQGSSRKHFWQNPDVGVNNYHLSNNCISNDPSSLFWTWFSEPISSISYNSDGAIGWTRNTDGGNTPSLQEGLLGPTEGAFRATASLGTAGFTTGGLNMSSNKFTVGDFLSCQGYVDSGSTSTFVLNFRNGHSALTYHIGWLVYREKAAL
jgi:hypothetical protein